MNDMNDMRKLIDAVQLNESVNTRVDESHGVPIDLLAKIGLYLDDPYGDGIRLDDIREPDEGRLAALQQVAGQPILDGETLIRDKYEEKVRWAVKSKAGRNDLVRQRVVTADELDQLQQR